tara:strand:- start:4837 stop:5157 length:321 start_codon:yes stop_codon:yes gene_type:complete
MDKSKYYYDYTRNCSCNCTCERKVEDCNNKKQCNISSDEKVPEYYKGKNGYEARKVCDNFELPYHLATATTYILRAYHKHDTPVDCISKAIAHLQFELDKINNGGK